LSCIEKQQSNHHCPEHLTIHKLMLRGKSNCLNYLGLSKILR
jgi:hypothetical protein